VLRRIRRVTHPVDVLSHAANTNATCRVTPSRERRRYPALPATNPVPTSRRVHMSVRRAATRGRVNRVARKSRCVATAVQRRSSSRALKRRLSLRTNPLNNSAAPSSARSLSPVAPTRVRAPVTSALARPTTSPAHSESHYVAVVSANARLCLAGKSTSVCFRAPTNAKRRNLQPNPSPPSENASEVVA